MSPGQFLAVQEAEYILHANNGRLRKLPVQKITLPFPTSTRSWLTQWMEDRRGPATDR